MRWRIELARMEARVMRAIGRGHATVRALSDHCGIERAQISRICFRLQGRNFVVRTDDLSIRRGTAVWALTQRGQMVVRGMDTPAPSPRRRRQMASARLAPAFAGELLQVAQPILQGTVRAQQASACEHQEATHG